MLIKDSNNNPNTQAPANFIEALLQTYQQNPCNVLPVAIWKTLSTLKEFNTHFTIDGAIVTQLKIFNEKQLMLFWQHPDNQILFSEKDLSKIDFALVHQDHIVNFSTTQFDQTPYFRLIHKHDNIPSINPKLGFSIRAVNPSKEKNTVAKLINNCYPDMHQTSETIMAWTKHPVFHPELWLWVIDEKNGKPAALGIAELDGEIREGSLEWIQVLPDYHGLGLGKWVCTELLNRLDEMADFTTVSGMVENDTHPEILYRKLGFIGDDVWWVLKRKED